MGTVKTAVGLYSVFPSYAKKSQKTYSVNRKDMSLSDNLFRFRSENIYIDVK